MLKSVCRSLAITCLLTLSTVAWAGDAHWIDVRTADEFSAGHVDDAVNIPYGEITERIAEVTQNKDELIYVYCRSGRRSGIAKDMLDEAGFTNVVNLGGLEDARKAAASH
jgi:phage shock protein E